MENLRVIDYFWLFETQYSLKRTSQVVLVGKEPACHYRRHERLGFDTWARKIPWRRAWPHISGFLPGESHRQKILVDCSPQGYKESDMTEATQQASKQQPQRFSKIVHKIYLVQAKIQVFNSVKILAHQVKNLLH